MGLFHEYYTHAHPGDKMADSIGTVGGPWAKLGDQSDHYDLRCKKNRSHCWAPRSRSLFSTNMNTNYHQQYRFLAEIWDTVFALRKSQIFGIPELFPIRPRQCSTLQCPNNNWDFPMSSGAVDVSEQLQPADRTPRSTSPSSASHVAASDLP